MIKHGAIKTIKLDALHVPVADSAVINFQHSRIILAYRWRGCVPDFSPKNDMIGDAGQ